MCATLPFVLASMNIKLYLNLYDLIALNHTEDCGTKYVYLYMYTYILYIIYNDIAEKNAHTHT